MLVRAIILISIAVVTGVFAAGFVVGSRSAVRAFTSGKLDETLARHGYFKGGRK